MTVTITPNGTRGFRVPRAFKPLARLHARLYKLVGGRGHKNMVVLSTLGSTSGLERSSTVASFPEGAGSWLVVASLGGAAKHPSWYVNLAKNPDGVYLQVRGKRYRVKPASLHGADRSAAWKRITREAPNFAEYQTKTDREIPVVRLTRIP
ncbi:MAG TPA: nitroreductase/quinone reductase family protein [Candidatus Acidoferrum sp.]|jgi:deazaflavin-dependent oxidoreductase (nitroreductase family)|nr:nitroreductase/quinone reductase family protein [Candidatus Acidoferrum sp.]